MTVASTWKKVIARCSRKLFNTSSDGGENRRPRYLNVGLKCSSEDPNEGINKPPKSQIAANVQVLEKECG